MGSDEDGMDPICVLCTTGRMDSLLTQGVVNHKEISGDVCHQRHNSEIASILKKDKLVLLVLLYSHFV